MNDQTVLVRAVALKGCVARMKASGLKGKARDDAAEHYLAGAAAVAKAVEVPLEPVDPEAGYLGVLEALAAQD